MPSLTVALLFSAAIMAMNVEIGVYGSSDSLLGSCGKNAHYAQDAPSCPKMCHIKDKNLINCFFPFPVHGCKCDEGLYRVSSIVQDGCVPKEECKGMLEGNGNSGSVSESGTIDNPNSDIKLLGGSQNDNSTEN